MDVYLPVVGHFLTIGGDRNAGTMYRLSRSYDLGGELVSQSLGFRQRAVEGGPDVRQVIIPVDKEFSTNELIDVIEAFMSGVAPNERRVQETIENIREGDHAMAGRRITDARDAQDLLASPAADAILSNMRMEERPLAHVVLSALVDELPGYPSDFRLPGTSYTRGDIIPDAVTQLDELNDTQRSRLTELTEVRTRVLLENITATAPDLSPFDDRLTMIPETLIADNAPTAVNVLESLTLTENTTLNVSPDENSTAEHQDIADFITRRLGDPETSTADRLAGQRGHTLVQTLVTMAIIGVLSYATLSRFPTAKFAAMEAAISAESHNYLSMAPDYMEQDNFHDFVNTDDKKIYVVGSTWYNPATEIWSQKFETMLGVSHRIATVGDIDYYFTRRFNVETGQFRDQFLSANGHRAYLDREFSSSEIVRIIGEYTKKTFAESYVEDDAAIQSLIRDIRGESSDAQEEDNSMTAQAITNEMLKTPQVQRTLRNFSGPKRTLYPLVMDDLILELGEQNGSYEIPGTIGMLTKSDIFPMAGLPDPEMMTEDQKVNLMQATLERVNIIMTDGQNIAGVPQDTADQETLVTAGETDSAMASQRDNNSVGGIALNASLLSMNVNREDNDTFTFIIPPDVLQEEITGIAPTILGILPADNLGQLLQLN